jgi:SAM-dependent methyltransferase
MRKVSSNIEWRKWGDIDPLWGVAAWSGKERGSADPWTAAEFFKLGELDWQDFFLHWERYGVEPARCLEIGCGAGRITTHLAKCFHRTYAVDVSDGMLRYARKHIEDTSVSFYLTDGASLPLPNQAVNAVFSCHVFQHFDSLEFASVYFAEISRVLAPQGTLMIHLPIYQYPAFGHLTRFFNGILSLRRSALIGKAQIQRWLLERRLARPFMRMTEYPVDYFYSLLPQYGFTDVEIAVFAMTSNDAPHSVVLARKVSDRL